MDGQIVRSARVNSYSAGKRTIGGRYTKSYNSDYQASYVYEKSEEKQKQREKVLDFILTNAKSRIKYLGFPGKDWMLERQLWAEDNTSRITGVEKNPSIYEKAKGYVPGRVALRDKSVSDGMKITYASSKQCLYFLGELKHFLDSHIRNKLLTSGAYRYGFSFRNAVWLDFTSPLCQPVWEVLVGLNRVLTPYDASICVTLLYGRDTLLETPGEEGRVQVIERAIPGFEAKKVWQYSGMNKSRMLTICGIRA